MNIIKKYTGRTLWLTGLMLTALMAGCSSGSGSSSTDPSTAPTVETAPADAEKNVALNAKVVATFSEDMDETTFTDLSFTVIDADRNEPLVGTVTYDAGTQTASFTPSINFTISTKHTATLTTTVKSALGTSLAADEVWSFTTGTTADDTAPTVISTNPSNTVVDTDVAINSSVTANFSEALDPTTIASASTTSTSAFTLWNDTTLVPGAVTYSKRVATFNPNSDLAASITYTAKLTTGIKDIAGNPLAAMEWNFKTGTTTRQGPEPVNLGTAENFAIVAASTITSAGSTTITGDIALSPAAGSFITVKCTEIVGEVYTVDAAYSNATCVNPDKTAAGLAVGDMQTAYTAASAPATPAAVGANLNIGAGTVTAQTLVPGTYTWGTNVTITGDITLEGGANDVWIFQIDGTLDTASAIILAGSAQAKNVFWRVADTVSLNPAAVFKGIVLAKTNIDMKDGATIDGRLLAQTGATLGTTTKVSQPVP